MKNIKWSFQLKKQLTLTLHMVFLCLVLTGVSLIYLNENFGRGLSWIHEESFADTFSFRELLEDDIEKIFQYVNYKGVFETEGRLDYEKDMISVTSSSGKTTIYTLDDMVRYAKSKGYYLDDSFSVQGGPSFPVSEKQELELLVNWKIYKPNEQYSEPGEAYASLGKLAKEVLTLLGDYYRIQYNYVEMPSNLYFRVSYMDDNSQEYIYTNAPGMSTEDIKRLGRYLYVPGDSILIQTNMKYIPSNISALLETYRVYDNNNYYIMIGLDTSYSNPDMYYTANNEYNKVRIDYIAGLVLLAMGSIGCLFTIYYLALMSGYLTSERCKIRLHGFDHIPLELTLLLYLLAIYVGRTLSSQIGVRFLYLVVDKHYWDYAKQLLQSTVTYLITLTGFFYLVRCYKASTLWSNSMMNLLYSWSRRFLTKSSFPLRLTFIFIGFWIVNICLMTSWGYLFFNQSLITIPYAYVIPILLIIGYNLWVYLILWRHATEQQKISQALTHMSDGDTSYKIDLSGFSGKMLALAQSINNIGFGLETALAEQVKSERLKADLITNVSHDIKTPLTSIISYVDLIKREKIQDQKIQRYLDVLDQKSQRLKTLTDDLVEASKVSSGNLKLEIGRIDFVELIHQTNGEFEEKFTLRHLELIFQLPSEAIFIEADGRRLWRVLENLYNNAFKYAMEYSRVYVDITTHDNWVYFTIKNISENPLNIRADELTERFVRGDVARTTEGSGLGLSIAKSLTALQQGDFELYIDGDLFKAQVGFPIR